MKSRIILFSSMFSLLISARAFSQCGMYELPLSQKVEKTSDIFEGKVISKNCFWNAQHSLIFTSNIIEVYKIFKGNIADAEVEIITEGGMIGDEMHSIEPNLNLSVGDIGIFMTLPAVIHNPLVQDTMPEFQCYGVMQGFFKYDLVTGTATVPFQKYNDIQNELYQPITDLIGEAVRVIKSFDLTQQITDAQLPIAKSGGSISGFNPTTITSGTNSVLTINGIGFGATQGSSVVHFKNPDDGGTTYNTASAFYYVSWSDTLIQVIVPAKSGTGTIQVVVGGATTLTSSSTLKVSYAEVNTTSVGIPYQTDLVTLNGAGGMTWQMNTSFDSNTAAKNAFNRALQTWSSNTQINWMVGSTTSVNSIGRDGTNVVRFDIGNELPTGTLARCSYYWLGCLTSVWYVSELDMAVDDGTSWQYGPALPTSALYDFETIMLHELGHGHQLGHVIDATDVMHYSTLTAVSKRTLNVSNTAGGIDIMSRSLVANSCGPGPMTVGINNYLNNNAFVIYPNPTAGSITVELPAEATNTHINIFNYLGEMVVSVSQNNGSKKLNIDLSNLNNGMYCIVVQSDGKVISEKVVLVK